MGYFGRKSKYKGECPKCKMDTVRGAQLSTYIEAKFVEFCSICDYHKAVDLLRGPSGRNSLGWDWNQCVNWVK